MNTVNALLIKQILEKWRSFDWQIQGLGMLRLYLSEEIRLHFWNQTLAYADNSTIHSHPWDFDSRVICGELTNIIYQCSSLPGKEGYTHYCQSIFCGPGGGLEKEPTLLHLSEKHRTVISALPMHNLSDYRQAAEEVHQTFAKPGTVTIVKRKFREDKDRALVFWPVGETWTSAEPRPAKPHEIYPTVQLCLEELKRCVSM